MQERSRGSRRFEPGGVERPTLASIYREEQTPAHWPPPARRASMQQNKQKPRAPRHGLIASQLGLPMQTRPTAHVTFPADNWQTRAAGDGDWPLECSTYDEDSELNKY